MLEEEDGSCEHKPNLGARGSGRARGSYWVDVGDETKPGGGAMGVDVFVGSSPLRTNPQRDGDYNSGQGAWVGSEVLVPLAALVGLEDERCGRGGLT